MYLIYLDESGNSGSNLNDPAQPIHYIGAIIIHSSQWLAIEQQVEQLVTDIGIVGLARENFEFHAQDLFRGKGLFRGWDATTRFDIFERLLQIVVNNNLPIIYAGIRKAQLQAKYVNPADPHDLAFLLCAERVERWFCDNAGTETGLYIADETKAKMSMKTSLRSYRRIGIQLGRPSRLEHVIDTIHFADSRETFPIQPIDCCIYAIKRKKENKKNADRLFNIISGQLSAGRLFP